jgi:hypothetical protein
MRWTTSIFPLIRFYNATDCAAQNLSLLRPKPSSPHRWKPSQLMQFSNPPTTCSLPLEDYKDPISTDHNINTNNKPFSSTLTNCHGGTTCFCTTSDQVTFQSQNYWPYSKTWIPSQLFLSSEGEAKDRRISVGAVIAS